MGIAISIFFGGFNALADKANSHPKNELGYYISLSRGAVRDDLLVPLAFSGPKITIGTKYSHSWNDLLLDNSFDISVLLLTNRFEHIAGGLKLNFTSELLNTVNHSKNKIMIGPMLSVQINDVLYSWDDSRIYWLTAYLFGISSKLEKPVTDRSVIDLSLQIPFLGFFSRPPEYRYNKQEALTKISYYFPNKDLQFSSLNNWKSISISTGWHKQLRKSCIETRIQYRYAKYSKPKDIYMDEFGLLFRQSWGL